MGRGTGQIIAGTAAIAASAIIPGSQGWLTSIGISLLANGALTSLQKRPRLAVGDGRDLGKNISDPVSALPVVYGPARVGLQRVYATVTDDNRFLWIVGALAHGPLASIGTVYLDGHAAIDANGRGIDGTAVAEQFVGYAQRWVAYGCDFQSGLVSNYRGRLTVTGSIRDGDNLRLLQTSAPHGYVVGDCLDTNAVVGLPNGEGFTVVGVPAPNQLHLRVWGAGDKVSGSGGDIGYYTPDLSVVSGAEWPVAAQGRGVAWLVLRLKYADDRFPGGVPQVTVDVGGTAVLDWRTAPTLPVASIGTGYNVGLAPAVQVAFTGAHGLTEGQILRLGGAPVGAATLRVDRVVDATHILAQTTATTFTHNGTAQPLTASANPIVCLADYLTSGVYGLAAPASEIDYTRCTTEANYCDQTVYSPVANTASFVASKNIIQLSPASAGTTLVTTGVLHGYVTGQTVQLSGTPEVDGQYAITVTGVTTFTIPRGISQTYPDPADPSPPGTEGTVQAQAVQARYALSGALDGNAALKSNLEAILAACRGLLVYQGGQYAGVIRRPGTATVAITEDDIVGPMTWRMAGQPDTVNAVRVTFFNPEKQWATDQVEYPPAGWANGFLTQDQGQLNRRDLELPLVGNAPRAAQIAQILRRESRVGLAAELTTTEVGIPLQVGDLVNVTHSSPGWTAKPFWVDRVEIRPNGTVALALDAYDATVYSLDAQDDTPFELLTTLPDPFHVAPPTNLHATIDTTRGAALLTWDASVTAAVSGYESQYKASSDTAVDAVWFAAPRATDLKVEVPELAPDTYDFRVRAVTQAGAHSPWATLTAVAVTKKPLALGMQAAFKSDGSLWLTIYAPDLATVTGKVAISTSAIPSDATVRAAATQTFSGTPAAPITLTFPGPYAAGSTVYFGGFGYNSAGVEGPRVSGQVSNTADATDFVCTEQMTETSTTGTLQLVITDPNSRLSSVEFKTKQGSAAAFSAYAVDSTVPYSASVTLVEKQVSQIGYRVKATPPGGGAVRVEREDTVAFAPGAIPLPPQVTASIDASGTLRIEVTGDSDTAGHRVTFSTSGYVSQATLDASTFYSGRHSTLNFANAYGASAIVYVSVEAQNASGVSSARVDATATRDPGGSQQRAAVFSLNSISVTQFTTTLGRVDFSFRIQDYGSATAAAANTTSTVNITLRRGDGTSLVIFGASPSSGVFTDNFFVSFEEESVIIVDYAGNTYTSQDQFQFPAPNFPFTGLSGGLGTPSLNANYGSTGKPSIIFSPSGSYPSGTTYDVDWQIVGPDIYESGTQANIASGTSLSCSAITSAGGSHVGHVTATVTARFKGRAYDSATTVMLSMNFA